jgi:hypothetical protein
MANNKRAISQGKYYTMAHKPNTERRKEGRKTTFPKGKDSPLLIPR